MEALVLHPSYSLVVVLHFIFIVYGNGNCVNDFQCILTQ